MSQKCGQFAETLISGYLLPPLLRDLRELRDTLQTARRYVHLPDSVLVSSVGAGYALHQHGACALRSTWLSSNLRNPSLAARPEHRWSSNRSLP